MQRISTVLRESDVKAVRRAASVEGAESIVITPIPYWLCGIDMVDRCSETRESKCDKQVRFAVTTDASRSGHIVSAIQRIVQAGKVVFPLGK